MAPHQVLDIARRVKEHGDNWAVRAWSEHNAARRTRLTTAFLTLVDSDIHHKHYGGPDELVMKLATTSDQPRIWQVKEAQI